MAVFIVAAAVALLPFGTEPVLAGPAFEQFVAAADAVCPYRHARNISPGDLDWIQERYIAKLPPAGRAYLAVANRGSTDCVGRDGLSCPTTATLAAFAQKRLMPSFAAFACSATLPR